MKFGIILPIWRLSVAEALHLTQQAEAAGWEAALIPDHVVAMPDTFASYGPSWPDPCATLAYLAGQTTRIQLGTSVIVLPYRNPLAVAKAVATVDQASAGRFICGVGVGWDAAEFQTVGVSFDDRGARSDEYLQIMKAAWAAESVSFHGKYFDFADAGFAPHPVQRPHPPIWVAGAPFAVSRPSIRRTIAAGDAWHPLGLNRDELRAGAELLRTESAKAGRATPPAFCPRNLLNLGEANGEDRAIFEGSVDQVTADLRYLADLGAEYATFDLYACSDVAAMGRMIEQFAREVRPALTPA